MLILDKGTFSIYNKDQSAVGGTSKNEHWGDIRWLEHCWLMTKSILGMVLER